MKKFAQYLAESERTYDYRIKLCGNPTTEFVRELKSKLDQFDPVKMSDIKTTPIQIIPTDFPNFKNEAVTMFDVSFRYPAIEPQIQQIAQLLGKNINMVRVLTQDFDDSINADNDKYANQPSPVLLEPNLEDAGKEASQDYANQYLDKIVPKKPSIDYKFDAKPTPTAPNKSKEGIQTKSPMSNIKRPDRPATGASK